MLKKLGFTIAATATGVAWGGIVAARRTWQRWGVTPIEATASLPGDDLVAAPSAVDTRGIDIAAPPATVWQWLVQMGYGRAGWYSYDGMDMDRPSLDRIVPELQSLAVGDILPTHPGGGFEVKVIEPEHALVVYADRTLVEAQAAEAAATRNGLETATPNVRVTGAYLDKAVTGEFAASWAFVVEPRGESASRLIERFRIAVEPPTRASGQPFALPSAAFGILGFGVFVMVRRQMLGIRDRAEGRRAVGAGTLATRIRARAANAMGTPIPVEVPAGA